MTEKQIASRIIKAVYCTKPYTFPCSTCAHHIFACKGRNQTKTKEETKQ